MASASDDDGGAAAALSSLSVEEAATGCAAPAASLAPCPTTAVVDASFLSPTRSRQAAAPAPTSPSTPAAAAGAVAGSEVPPSPLELRSPGPGAEKHSPWAAIFSSRHKNLPGKIVCDFKRQVLEFTPDEPGAAGRLQVFLRDVQLYTLTPVVLGLELTLKETVPGIVASPGATLPANIHPRDCKFTFKTQQSYEKVAAGMTAALVFRSGTFDTDFEHVPGIAPLGKGTFGECRVVRRRGSAADATEFCVKIPHIGKFLHPNEVEMMIELRDCEFITRYEKFYETKSGDTAISQHLVMELMSGGDLMVDVLLKRRTLRGLAGEWMSAAEVRVATWRILKGLEFMHAKKCLHRDLKPENCLLKQRLPDGCGDAATLKLADFGHSKLVPPDVSRAYTNNRGTAAYAAPEMAAQMILGSTNRGHTAASDLWSVGIIIYVMVVQSFPWYADPTDEKNEAAVRAEVMQGLTPNCVATRRLRSSPRYAACDPNGRNLLEALLQREPGARLSAAAAAAHPWFAGM